MSNLVYMVEQIEVQRARVLSSWATYKLAEAEVLRIIATMLGYENYPWEPRPGLKRMSANQGKTEMVWSSKLVTQVSAFAVVSFEVQGSAVERLGELADG